MNAILRQTMLATFKSARFRKRCFVVFVQGYVSFRYRQFNIVPMRCFSHSVFHSVIYRVSNSIQFRNALTARRLTRLPFLGVIMQYKVCFDNRVKLFKLFHILFLFRSNSLQPQWLFIDRSTFWLQFVITAICHLTPSQNHLETKRLWAHCHTVN